MNKKYIGYLIAAISVMPLAHADIVSGAPDTTDGTIIIIVGVVIAVIAVISWLSIMRMKKNAAK